MLLWLGDFQGRQKPGPRLEGGKASCEEGKGVTQAREAAEQRVTRASGLGTPAGLGILADSKS